MCVRHEPIKVYDSGGTQIICKNCGAPMSDWVQNNGKGKHEQKKEAAVQNVQQGVK